ncbi:hypothetical protein ACFPQ7_21870 [Methylobacterium iners]
MGRSSRGDDGGWGINPNWIVDKVIQETQTNYARVNITNCILRELLKDDPLEKVWIRLAERLNSVAHQRNIIVHSEWAWSEDAPEGIIQLCSDEKHKFWIESDFADVFSRTKSLETDIHAFMREVLIAIHDRRVTRFVTPEMIVKSDAGRD